MKNKQICNTLIICIIILITVFIVQVAAVDFKGTSLGDPSRGNEPSPSPDILVKVNDKLIVFDVKPIIINDRTMVPLRAIFEALGAQVTWDGETKTIYGSKGSNIIILQIDNAKAFVNSAEVVLDVAPQIIDGRTLVPTRFIAEALGADVKWDADNNSVIINDTKVGVYKKISPENTKQSIVDKAVLIIDVRTQDEYKTGHIEGSINITNTELKDKIVQIAPDKATEIILYCRSGSRSKVSANELIAMGYINVSDLGGIIDWPYEIKK